MLLFELPKNYRELIKVLYLWTGIFTFIFLIVLVILERIPIVSLNKEFLPNDSSVAYFLKFGLIPAFGGLASMILSRFSEMHNLVAKMIGLRKYWDRTFIAEVMIKDLIGKLDKKLTSTTIDSIINEIYFPGVKEIDQHYPEIFWAYALSFWVLFEHMIIALIIGFSFMFFDQSTAIWIFLWSVIIMMLLILNLHYVVGKKSKDQALQVISINKYRLALSDLLEKQKANQSDTVSED